MSGVVGVVLGMMAVGGHTSQQPTGLEADWRRDYPAAARRWDDVASAFVAKGRSSFRWFAGFTTRSDDFTVATSGDKYLLIEGRRSTLNPGKPTHPSPSLVTCRTKDYAFDLKTQVGSDRYFILNHGEPPTKDLKFENDFLIFARSATTFLGSSLLHRMQSPAFTVQSVDKLERGSEELIQIRYTFTEDDITEDGTVILDPSKDWAIRSVNVALLWGKSQARTSTTVEVSYKKGDESHLFPGRIDTMATQAMPGVFQRSLYEFEHVRLGEAPESMFHLPAYGLPEIPLRPSPRYSLFTLRNPVIWVALGAAVVCFGLLAVLRSRNQRLVS